MDYFEQNMSVIKKARPSLYKELKYIFDSKVYSYSNIEEADTRDGNKALIIEKDKNKYRMNSIYKPLDEAKKWANQYEFGNIDVSVIMFGMGNGLFVNEMLQRLQSDAKVYIYEPDISIFLYVVNNVDITGILKEERVYLIINDINEYEFGVLLKRDIDWIMLRTQIICNHPVYDKVYGDEYEEFLRTVYDANKIAIVNIDTERYMSATLVDNVLRNLKYIKESNYISEFVTRIPEEIPVIIVSAGPSLDKNIDELKRAEGKAFIMATDTSVKYLLKHNINFDAMITIDAKKSIKHLSDERCDNIPLFCVLEAKSHLMDKHKGRKIWIRGSVYMYELYNKFKRIFPGYNSGGSVATSAFSSCVSMNFRNIILIGQDLAYDGELTHAGGVVRNKPGDESDRKLVEGIDGKKVWSRYDWLVYLEWFEHVIKDNEELNVIDATEGGALIHGTKVMKLSEAIDEYCKTDFSFARLLNELPYTFSDDEYIEVRNTMLHLSKEFISIKQKSKEGLEAANKLLKIIKAEKYNTKTESKNLKKIDKINKFLARQDAYSILDVYIMNSVSKDIQSVNNISGDENENMKKTLDISIAIYEALIKAVDELTPVLEESLEQI